MKTGLCDERELATPRLSSGVQELRMAPMFTLCSKSWTRRTSAGTLSSSYSPLTRREQPPTLTVSQSVQISEARRILNASWNRSLAFVELVLLRCTYRLRKLFQKRLPRLRESPCFARIMCRTLRRTN